MAAMSNQPSKDISKIEKVGDKLQVIKLVEDITSRKIRESDNARNGSPIRKAIYITAVVVACTLLSLILRSAVVKFEEQSQQLSEYRGKINDLSQRISEVTKLQAKDLNIRLATDCSKVTHNDAKTTTGNGGLFDIYQVLPKTEVFCDLKTDGGGWTVFQRRMDGSEDFYRGWEDYVRGFGNPEKEFWLGLNSLHKLTTDKRYELRIDMEDWEGDKRYAKYSFFRIASIEDKYRLTVSGYSGNSGDSLSMHSGMKFSAKDRDHDIKGAGNCAATYKGAWWYNSCHDSNLNAQYLKGSHKSYADGINWFSWKGHHYSLKFVEMKIRPTDNILS